MSLGAGRATSTREYQLLDTGTITSTGSQNYTIPAGTLYLEIECWGAGGGGGGRHWVAGQRGYSYYAGGGGGGGAYFKKTYYGHAGDMTSGDLLNFTVGAGGDGGADDAAAGSDGDVGENTTLVKHTDSLGTGLILEFSSVIAGGGGGGESDTDSAGGDAGTATNGDINTNGEAGDDRSGENGGDGGDGADPNGGAGGAGGVGGLNPSNASDGTVPGGGGGGANGARLSLQHESGDGANGKVIVKAYG